MPLSHRILIVHDRPELRRSLRASLAAAGFDVEEAAGGEPAMHAFSRRRAEVVLFDINMPGAAGLETCRRLRALDPDAGIIMITARDCEEDVVGALDAGADDYIIKPYRLRELMARMRALLRRSKSEPTEALLRAGALELDLKKRILKKAEALIHLSPTEFDLMAFFLSNQGSPVTHARLLRSIWGPEYGGELEYLRSYVRMLRKKIEDDPSRPAYIVTEPWVGYRFCNPAEAE